MQVLYQLFKIVLSSSAKAELVALFMTGRKRMTLRLELIELCYPKLSVPLIIDN